MFPPEQQWRHRPDLKGFWWYQRGLCLIFGHRVQWKQARPDKPYCYWCGTNLKENHVDRRR